MTGITHIIDTVTFDHVHRLIFFEDKSASVDIIKLTARDDNGKLILRLGVNDDVFFIRCTSDNPSEIRKSNKYINSVLEEYNEVLKIPPIPESDPEPIIEEEPPKEAEKVSDWIDLADIDIDENAGTIRIGTITYPANRVRVVLTTAFERKALSILTPDGHHTAYSTEAKIYSSFDNNNKVTALSWKADQASQRASRLQYLDELKSGVFPTVSTSVSLNPDETAIIVEEKVTYMEPIRESASNPKKPFGVFRSIGETILPKTINSKSRETMKAIETGTLVLTPKRLIFVGTNRNFAVSLGAISHPVLDLKQMMIQFPENPVTLRNIDGEAWSAAFTTLLS